MIKWFKRLFRRGKKPMRNQDLTDITRGLQHAAATTNSMVAEQYIRILSQFFDTLEDGTLKAKMVRVQINDDHYALVPLVSLVAPAGLALEKMRVELSMKIHEATERRATILDIRHGHKNDDELVEDTRSAFAVSMSPRTRTETNRRPSDHIDIVLEFVARETPEAVMRVIDTYTNLIQPIKMPDDGKPPPHDIINMKTGQKFQMAGNEEAVDGAGNDGSSAGDSKPHEEDTSDADDVKEDTDDTLHSAGEADETDEDERRSGDEDPDNKGDKV